MTRRLRVLVVVLALGGSSTAQVLPARGFATATFYPLSMATGDLDGDGLADLVTGGDALAILLRDPAGDFFPPINLPATGGAYVVALGNVNADDALDLVCTAALGGASSVSVRLGNGAGGFGPAVTIAVPTYPYSMVLGDFDGDGHDDAAASSDFLDAITLVLSDGSGGLTIAGSTPLSGQPYHMERADLDEDGDLDLAVVQTYAATLSLLSNDGAGHFTTTAVPAPRLYPGDVLSGDVDEDGDIDLLLSSLDALVFYEGHGDGTFAPWEDTGLLASGMQLADMDGNGFEDLAASTDHGITALPGAAGPAFGAGPPGFELNSGLVGVLDTDDDGLLDILVLMPGGGQVIVLRGLGFGEFENVVVSELTGGPRDVVTADLDGDADIDAAVAKSDSFGLGGGVAALRNEDGGHLTEVSDTNLGPMLDIEAGDVDANGDMDLVSTGNQAHIKVQLGDGSGLYGAATTVGAALATEDSDVGDVDGDGDDDIATCFGTGAAGQLAMFLSDGAGGFSGPVSRVVGVTPSDVELADLNGDGHLDLVGLSTAQDKAIGVLIHGGALGTPVLTSVPGGSLDMGTGNVDGDGLADLVTLHFEAPFGNAFRVFRGDGAGGFVFQQVLPASFGLADLVVTDMNGDGAADILSTQATQDANVVLAVNDGAGTFPPAQLHAGRPFPVAVAAGDLTGDGLMDALTINWLSGMQTPEVTLFGNIGPPQPWKHLGFGKFGVAGIPMLVGHGTLLAGAPLTLELRGAAPSSAATLVLGLASLFAPFKGGVLVPMPSFLLGGLVTNGKGGMLLSADWPSDVPAGLQSWYQFWIADPSASAGYAASNGVTATAP